MKKFFYKFIIVLTLFSIIVYAVFTYADGYTDPFYVRFTTPKQENLVLGTSRSAQGILPSILKKEIDKKFFNFSFTISHSPYGEVYLKAIKRKLKKESKNQLFILAVDPWSISSRTSNPNDHDNFREKNLILDNMMLFNYNPNFEYILKNYKGSYLELLDKSDCKNNMFLHDNGWLEVNFNMDNEVVEKNIENKIKFYKDKQLPKYSFSSRRFKKLRETITYLNEYGNVFLVRLPVHKEMFNLEQQLMPDFNQKIRQLDSIIIKYTDFTDKNDIYEYTDGNHLYKTSGSKITKEISNIIKLELK